MLNTRTLRLVVPIIAFITILLVIFTSYGSINDSIQKVKEKTSDADAFTHVEETKNTLQGKPHEGTKAPYEAHDDEKVDYADGVKAGKVVADTSQSEKSHSDKAKPGSASVGDGNAVLVDDENDSENKGTASKPKDKGKDSKKGGASSGKCSDQEFVVMIDAGSSGSRVHVYEFDTCQSPPALKSEVFEMLKPGLSSYDTDTVGAAKSLDKLLDKALESVPKDKQGCTPVAVKATAGLRLLGEEKSSAILKEVIRHLEEDYPFAVVAGDGISIMEGKDEGVYAWITANYLLGNIGSSEKNPTAAVFDLGGGSTQIVFEPEFKTDEKMVEGEHKHSMTFGNRDFTLYQYSHLGFGLNEGRNKINGLIVSSELKSNEKLKKSKISSKAELKDKEATVTLNSPCIAPGLTAHNVEVKLSEDEYYLVNMQGPPKDSSIHSGANCRFLAEKVLNKELECSEKPCSFNGIYQPSLAKSFGKESDMYVFSYFYDKTSPLGFPSSFTLEELKELTKVVCGGEALWTSALLEDGIKELTKEDEAQWCLDLTFITAILHTGYDIPLHRELKTAKTIDNNELGWCLGASLPLLDKASGWTCKIKEIS